MFPTNAIPDEGGVPFISRVHGERLRSCKTPTAAPNVADQLSASDFTPSAGSAFLARHFFLRSALSDLHK